MSEITVYHGSSVPVEQPRLLENQRELDFGRGFYTTTDLEQAARWAKRTALRLKQEACFVTTYTVDQEALRSLRVLSFDCPDEAWLNFVVSNRKGVPSKETWDVVFGPVANDQTMPVITLFLDGMYDMNEAIKRLLPQKLKDQYAFKTEDSLKLLCCKEVIRL